MINDLHTVFESRNIRKIFAFFCIFGFLKHKTVKTYSIGKNLLQILFQPTSMACSCHQIAASHSCKKKTKYSINLTLNRTLLTNQHWLLIPVAPLCISEKWLLKRPVQGIWRLVPKVTKQLNPQLATLILEKLWYGEHFIGHTIIEAMAEKSQILVPDCCRAG